MHFQISLNITILYLRCLYFRCTSHTSSFSFVYFQLICPSKTSMQFYKWHSKLSRAALKRGSQRSVWHDDKRLLGIQKASVREFCWCVSRLKYETLSCLPLWFHGHISLRQRYEGIGPAQSGSVNANLSFKHPAVSFIFIWFCILTGWCWFSLFRIRWSSWSWRKCLKCFYRVHTDLESSAQY